MELGVTIGAAIPMNSTRHCREKRWCAAIDVQDPEVAGAVDGDTRHSSIFAREVEVIGGAAGSPLIVGVSPLVVPV